MLESLHLNNVGRAPAMELELAPRLNLITGDNGFGKSFLLDVAWWALTRRWPQDLNYMLTSGYAARPTDVKKPASIGFCVRSKSQSACYESSYVPREDSWLGKAGRPMNRALVIYAHSDGGFSVWDPARNAWKKKGNADVQERLPGYAFSPKEVWDGRTVEIKGKVAIVSNGLLRDWANWIRENGEMADIMTMVLAGLSPSQDRNDQLEPGPLTRISVSDVRDIPSLQTGTGPAIPILHASSGVRRIVTLAYMLLWSWNEHRLAAQQLGEAFTSHMILLIDEPESHLHPRWQRSILDSMLKLPDLLPKTAMTQIQFIIATHAPLILASAETSFEATQDAWFALELKRTKQGDRVELTKRLRRQDRPQERDQ